MAKTQYSFSDDPTLLGAPRGFQITIKDVKVCSGAGFVVAKTGDIMTMPGLPKGAGGGEDRRRRKRRHHRAFLKVGRHVAISPAWLRLQNSSHTFFALAIECRNMETSRRKKMESNVALRGCSFGTENSATRHTEKFLYL